MAIPPDRCELAQNALANAKRVASQLRRHEQDLAQKTPGEAEGVSLLGGAAAAAERLAGLLNTPRSISKPSPLDS